MGLFSFSYTFLFFFFFFFSFSELLKSSRIVTAARDAPSSRIVVLFIETQQDLGARWWVPPIIVHSADSSSALTHRAGGEDSAIYGRSFINDDFSPALLCRLSGSS
jgi:hypothetical protein